VDKVGSYQLHFTNGTQTVDSSGVGFAITAAAIDHLTVTAQPGAAAAGASLGTVTVETRDQFENVVSSGTGITATLVTTGGATLSGGAAQTPVSGVATFSALSVDKAGSYQLHFTNGTQSVDSDSAGFVVTATVADHLAFLTQPTDAVVGVAQSGDVEVEILDQFGNRVNTADAVALAFGTNPSSATLGGTTSLAAVAGVATFPGLTVSAVGANYTLVASSGALATDTSATFDITAAPGGSGSGSSSSSGGGCGLGSAAPFAALMMMLLMMARLRSARRSDHHV
jgi:hypothetical protein